MGMSYKVNKENMSITANGANTHMTTNDECLDFFALGGAMRENNEKEILTLFNAAFESNKLLAMKLLFYMRDIRGGQGERRIFRIILKHLANTNPDVVSKNLELIPEFGRWDDLYALEGTPLEREMFAFAVYISNIAVNVYNSNNGNQDEFAIEDDSSTKYSC